MKTTLTGLATLAAATAFGTVPTVSDVAYVQDPSSRRMTITYKIDAPAVITIGVQTNAPGCDWVDLPDSARSHFTGACNRLVTETGVEQTAFWQPDKAWPGHKITTENARVVVTAWAKDSPPDYMAVSLTDGSKRFYSCVEAVPGGATNTLYKSSVMLFRRIPAAGVIWRIGAPDIEVGNKFKDAWPHLVTLKEDYYIGIYPATTYQMKLLTGTTYSYGVSTDFDYCPAQYISWTAMRGSGSTWPTSDNSHRVDAGSLLSDYIRPKMKISDLDLPTDAQWEYACRAGCASALYNGSELALFDDSDLAAERAVNLQLSEIAWWKGNSDEGYGTPRVHHVGEKQPNAWGIYDMIGNSLEWVLDWYEDWYSGNFDAGEVREDPVGPSSGSSRVVRGGGAESTARSCRSAYRALWTPDTKKDGTVRLSCSIKNVLAE